MIRKCTPARIPYAIMAMVCGIQLVLVSGCTDTVEKTSVSGISTRAAVSIDARLCIGCAAQPCLETCPQRAIDSLVVDGEYIYVIDPGKCNNCGACINSCPYNAIVWKR